MPPSNPARCSSATSSFITPAVSAIIFLLFDLRTARLQQREECGGGHWNPHVKGCALSRRAFEPERSAVRLRQPPRDRQPKSRPAAMPQASFGLPEHLKNRFVIF